MASFSTTLNDTLGNMTINISGSSIAENCSSLTPVQRNTLNVPVSLISSVIIAAQLFNLVTFHHWRTKEPFVLLHVSLSWVSLLDGVAAYFAVFARFFSYYDPVIANVNRAFVTLFPFIQAITLSQLLCISIDRWLATEFAIRYRNQITIRKIRIVIGVLWASTAMLFFRDDFFRKFNFTKMKNGWFFRRKIQSFGAHKVPWQAVNQTSILVSEKDTAKLEKSLVTKVD